MGPPDEKGRAAEAVPALPKSLDGDNTRIHPAAEAWPRLPGDELAQLAKSIAEVGLLEPIVVTVDGQLLDGRNRLAACKIVGVEPTTVTYDGDPVAFVLARNEHRRHMSKGQRAMAAWMTAATDPLNDLTQAGLARSADVSKPMMTWAKTVAEHAPELVTDVIAGELALNEAYIRARGGQPPVESTPTPPAEKIVTDAEIERAAHTILRARAEHSSGRHTPGPTAALLLTFVRPETDWDDELATLSGLNQSGGDPEAEGAAIKRDLDAVKRRLYDILKVSFGVQFTDELEELMRDSVAQIRETLDQFAKAVTP